MKTVFALTAALLFGCANPPTSDQCQEYVDVAAQLATIVTSHATTNEAKLEAQARYTPLAAEAAKLGCVIAPLD